MKLCSDYEIFSITQTSHRSGKIVVKLFLVGTIMLREIDCDNHILLDRISQKKEQISP